MQANCEWPSRCIRKGVPSDQRSMTLKIERISSKRRTRIRLSGAFRSEHRDQVKAEIELGGPRIALDLEEVDLVDVEGVRFLKRVRGRGDLSAALLALYQGMDAPGTRVGQKHRVGVTREKLVGGIGGRRWKAGMERCRRLYKWKPASTKPAYWQLQRAEKLRRSTRCIEHIRKSSFALCIA